MNRMYVVPLSLLLLLAVGIQGIVTILNNNCKCRTMSPNPLPVRLLTKFETFPITPSCDQIEYIATLKPLGKQQCLDPASPAVQRMLKKYEKLRALKKSQQGSSRKMKSQ